VRITLASLKLSRGLISLFFSLSLLIFSPQTLEAASYSALIIDAQTGEILHAENPNKSVHPASLTKIMTAYLLFQELEAGRLTLNSVCKVSKKAASQAPTKLGISAGKTVLLKDALLALITRSANDMAVVIAEKISGSEAAFVQRMNHTARALGMPHTYFKNSSGLPHKHQITTALDMARLSQALLKRFPFYYKYFNTKAFTYKGQRIHNHNKLLGRVEGVDGIKTGFTCASGFNIATSAVRKGRRLIGIVMGGETAQWRDRRITKFLEASFSKSFKNKKYIMDDPLFTAEEKPQYMSASSKGHISHRDSESTDNLEDVAETSPQKAVYVETEELANQPVKIYPKDKSIKKDLGEWYVQIGTYKQAKDAHIAAALSLEKLPKEYDPLISISKSNLKRAKVYKARLGGLDRTAARRACKILKSQGISCLVTKNPPISKMMTAMVEAG
jgi:D-alanyl-D-alanine carboxypeptidase